MSLKGIKATISGRVQGVYYRKNTLKKAQQLNVTGWVQNHQDGSVILEAFGDEIALQQLIAWLHKGPLLAKVEKVTYTPIGYQEHAHFVIKP